MDIYQHRRHNKNLLMVHLIFVTKYRKKIVDQNDRDGGSFTVSVVRNFK